MFEVGKKYEVRMVVDGKETRFWGIVEKFEHPLLKFSNTKITWADATEIGTIKGEIINVTSSNFISAKEAE